MDKELKYAVCVKRYRTEYINGGRTTTDYMKLGQIGELKSKNHLSILGTVMGTDVRLSQLKFFETLEEAEEFSKKVKDGVKTLEDLLGSTLHF
jgi:hypothetical protein